MSFGERQTLGLSKSLPPGIRGKPTGDPQRDVRLWPSAGFMPNETKVKRNDFIRNGGYWFDGSLRPSSFSKPPIEDPRTATMSWGPDVSLKTGLDPEATHPSMWSKKEIHDSRVVVRPKVTPGNPRRDPLPGYRGYIPSTKAETIFGSTLRVASQEAHAIREYKIEREDTDERYRWNVAPDSPERKRQHCAVGHWFMRGTDGDQRPVDHGPGLPGYTGPKQLHTSQSDPALTRTNLAPTQRLQLPHRDLAPTLSGYAGHIRGKYSDFSGCTFLAEAPEHCRHNFGEFTGKSYGQLFAESQRLAASQVRNDSC